MLPSGQTGEIIKNLSLRREHILSQSEIVLPLRKTCYYSPLAEVGVFSTEIISRAVSSETGVAYTLSPKKYQKNIEKGIYNNANSFSFFHLTISIQHK